MRTISIRIFALTGVAVAFPYAATCLTGSCSRKILYPGNGITSLLAWALFFAVVAFALTAVGRPQTSLAGALLGATASTQTFATGRPVAAMLLLGCSILGSIAGMRLRPQDISRVAQAHRLTYLLLFVVAVAGSLVVGMDTAKSVALHILEGDRALAVSDSPDGRFSAVLVAHGSLTQPDSAGLAVVVLRRNFHGYWSVGVRKGIDPDGLPLEERFFSFERNCPTRQYEMTADRFGVCPLVDLVSDGRLSSVVAGVAPRQAATVEVVRPRGTEIHRLSPPFEHGFLFWSSPSGISEIARIAFRDAMGNLLDARLGPDFDPGEDETVARIAAGCNGRSTCPTINERFVVSSSLLTPDEFSRLCRQEPPPGDWVEISSVYVGDHDLPVYEGITASDRRLVGPYIRRFALGRGLNAGGIKEFHPSNPSGPCFPTDLNSPL